MKVLKFNHFNAKPTDFITFMENGLRNCSLPEDRREAIRIKICQQLKQRKQSQLIPDIEMKALKSLKNGYNILILTADKVNAIALLDKTEYTKKIRQLIEDKETYQLLNGNPVKELRNQLTKSFSTLKKNKKQTDEEYRPVKPTEGLTIWFYGLPKVYKPHVPLRLIVAPTKAPNYNLARTKLSVDEMAKLVEICMETYFQFDGKVNQQIRGTPLGSPFTGQLADAVMKQFGTKAFEILQPRLWIRYVDDTFVVLRASTVDQFHQMINEQVPGINFTREE
ncbi:unnamed protein product [Echinostoma caproni]|uniref:Reverse transcriptase domain-containing protein n=1 Tax=Echinostoma caproni TaxID=27848 RepID=A0A183B430_9TREM|nr:unnamed protein product [Echinostoma caproni]